MPTGTWHWREGDVLFHILLANRAQRFYFHQSTKKRDMKRIYVNEFTRWMRYNPSLMTKLTKTNLATPGRNTCLIEWLMRGTSPREEQSCCTFCGMPEIQKHINVACTHPPLAKIRRMHRRYVDAFFQSYRHQHKTKMDCYSARLHGRSPVVR